MPAELPTLDPAAASAAARYRFPALLWALVHLPLFLALYAGSIGAALRATPAQFRPWLWPTFLPQAALISAVGFVVALPASFWPRVYRFAAPATMALLTAVVALDSRVYSAVSFHLNGFFLRVVVQPNALRETGVPLPEVWLFVLAAAAFVAADVGLGAWFIRRFASGRRAWTWAVALLLLSAVERVYGGTLTAFGGPAIFAASMVLPLQVPVRMEKSVRAVLHRGGPANPFAGAGALRLPAGIAAADVRFARKPDVVILLAESLPAEHLDAKTMPNMWRRAQGGARFTRHYAGACATNYTLFSLMYGLQAQKLELIVGSGRQPVLFPALRANGYQMRALAASCVDWMGLRETVFAGVGNDELKTWCGGDPSDVRDGAMLRDAEDFVARADKDRPLFLFVFFESTHFNYTYPPEHAVFTPAWDGTGLIKASAAPGWLIQNRARNSAHALDAVIEPFLRFLEEKRGRSPVVFFTGDHGEEFRQKGHIGHGSSVVDEQVHVPLVVLGDGIAPGVHDVPTSHVDLVPTIFDLLGDRHAPSLYADGVSLFHAPEDRFVLTTVGWEPHYAAIGKDLKVTMYAGMATAEVTDPEDRPIADGQRRLAANAGRIMRALRGETVEAPDSAVPGAASASAPAAPPP